MDITDNTLPASETTSDFSSLNNCAAAQRALDYYLKPAVSDPQVIERFFDVSPHVSREEALAHASDLLRCAAASAHESADNLQGPRRDLAFSVVHMIDMAKAMVDRSLDAERIY